jgi:hypothetical protein
MLRTHKNQSKMLTGDPIQDDVQWLLQELKQVDQDIEIVRKYYEFFERGNTVSTRYQAINEEKCLGYAQLPCGTNENSSRCEGRYPL